MDVLHAHVLHHRCFFVNVWSDDTERWAALFDHPCTCEGDKRKGNAQNKELLHKLNWLLAAVEAAHAPFLRKYSATSAATWT